MAADHIYPETLIKELPGFDKLTPEQQKMVLNYERNFQPLPDWLNSSKGAKTYFEWKGAPEKPYDSGSFRKFNPKYLESMQLLTIQIKQELQTKIDELLRACNPR